MPPIACWSAQAFLPVCGPVLSWSNLLPYLFPSFLCYFMGPWSRCFRIPENPCPACPISVVFRKPSVYAGKNQPTAVYDAALFGVCQSKNRDLFRFRLVFPRFVPISWVLQRFSQIAVEKIQFACRGFPQENQSSRPFREHSKF